MRIAVSGSHSLGKSTLVRDFIQSHRQYTFEEEPYRALHLKHDIKFAEEQTAHHIRLQLDYCIERLKQYHPGANVICDRCPIDYIPYADYTAHFGHTDIDHAFVQSLYPDVINSLQQLDLIIFIPISDKHPIELENDGHRPTHDFYREWVDRAFKKFYQENLKSLPPTQFIEVVGNRQARLKKIAEEMGKISS